MRLGGSKIAEQEMVLTKGQIVVRLIEQVLRRLNRRNRSTSRFECLLQKTP